MAAQLGLDWRYADVCEVFDEMRRTMPHIAGITWQRLPREHAVTSPCTPEGDPGEPVVFMPDFPREGAVRRSRQHRHICGLHPGMQGTIEVVAK
jgi:formate dehydrogenase major subunit